MVFFKQILHYRLKTNEVLRLEFALWVEQFLHSIQVLSLRSFRPGTVVWRDKHHI